MVYLELLQSQLQSLVVLQEPYSLNQDLANTQQWVEDKIMNFSHYFLINFENKIKRDLK
jgi:hypothetical protein